MGRLEESGKPEKKFPCGLDELVLVVLLELSIGASVILNSTFGDFGFWGNPSIDASVQYPDGPCLGFSSTSQHQLWLEIAERSLCKVRPMCLDR